MYFIRLAGLDHVTISHQQMPFNNPITTLYHHHCPPPHTSTHIPNAKRHDDVKENDANGSKMHRMRQDREGGGEEHGKGRERAVQGTPALFFFFFLDLIHYTRIPPAKHNQNATNMPIWACWWCSAASPSQHNPSLQLHSLPIRTPTCPFGCIGGLQ